MRLLRMTLKEIAHRKLTFFLSVAAVVIATGAALGFSGALTVYELRSKAVLTQKREDLEADLAVLQDEMRKATLKLSFNLVILPQDQDVHEWYETDYGTTYMPESYVERLADSAILTVRHFLPSLQQKVKWPEQKRTIILVGCRGEVPNLHKSPRTPLVQPVPEGTIVLGHELHGSLGLKAGDAVRLMGREFTVHACHEERGSKDDITAWISLADAQELLEKPGLINGILALECICGGGTTVDMVRADVARILPDTQVIEMGTRIVARAEARTSVGREAKAALDREEKHQEDLQARRERFAGVVLPVIVIACGFWVAFLALDNVRKRRSEVGILRAIGCRGRQVFQIFLAKAAATGLFGGAVGCGVGLLVAASLASGLDAPLVGPEGILSLRWVLGALAGAPILAVIASWLPAVLASQQDPAEILREE